ncbi:MAG: AcrB/AcrD/AcrF family protein [Comamonadaceae bacterium CG_4_9_14_0_8_um_filter_57_21]|nr:MAG: AcrB/AcrD/AcrF family protein [Comamonadaceae bacterium CG_4_9_14_0_8_um_filter_57_21]
MLFRYFYTRPLLLAMILFIGSIMGVLGYINLPRNMYPDVERSQVVVVTQLPGAAAQTVAQKVSRPIEQELYALAGIRDVQSTNKNEVSIIKAEFEYGKDLNTATVDVNNAISRARGKLPPETPPSGVFTVGGFTQPVLVLSLSPKPGSDVGLSQIRLIAENDLRTALLTQGHIANVEIFGGHEPAVRIEFDPLKLISYHVSQTQLQEFMGKIGRDYPVGITQSASAFSTLTVYGERVSVEALRRLPLINGLVLGDVAQVTLGQAERYSAFHGNGKEAIAMAIQRAPGESVQGAILDTNRALKDMKVRYSNIQFEIADTQEELIETSNSNIIDALRDAIIFVSIVMLFFLSNWRAVVISFISIPLVFLLTLATLWLMGKELNLTVMTGIILALGMLVDNAVVVLENIERHLHDLKEEVDTAIRRGTEEVLSPVLVGTIGTVVVIAPLMYIGGFPEAIFAHLVRPVLIAAFVSYFLAVTFIPLVSAYWYRNGLPPKNRWESAIERFYQRTLAPGAGMYVGMLGFALKGGWLRRTLLVLPAVLLLAFSIRVIMPLVGRDAMPPMDTGVVKVHVKFGGNVPVAEVEQRLQAFEAVLKEDKRIERSTLFVGSEAGVLSMGSGQLPGEATFNITYVDRLHRDQTSWQIETELRQKLAGVPGVVSADVFDGGATALSTIKAPVDIRLVSEDWQLLTRTAEDVKVALAKVPGITTVSTSWDRYSEESVLVLDEEKLRLLGATPDQVVGQLPLKGAPVASLSKLPSVGALPVRTYFGETYRSNPQALMLLPIQLANGQVVSLGQVAHLQRHNGTAILTTDGVHFALDVFAYRNTKPISMLSDEAVAAVTKVVPPGVTFTDEGDYASSKDSGKRMAVGLGLGVLLLFAVLVPAYRSIGLGLLSVLILPLSVIGALWGLLAFGKALALSAILGVVLLFAIIIKNSILMVDFIQERRKEGQSAREAAEGSVRLRYRPILMTALATIAGMIPIAMENAIGLERLSPLADAAIGGLLVGTFMSLFYLPLFYVWMSEKGK